MKKLGICLDGVLRDKLYQFDKYYRKEYIKNNGLVQMTENFEVIDEEDGESETMRLSLLEKTKIHLPISTYDLTNHYEFESTEEFNIFNERFVFELFGSAPPVHSKAMDAANRICNAGIDTAKFQTYLICPGAEQAITATYYYLTRNTCRIGNIIFRQYTETLWNELDVIITDCPDILDSKPDGKLSIKIDGPYNATSNSNLAFNKIIDIYENGGLHQICELVY